MQKKVIPSGLSRVELEYTAAVELQRVMVKYLGLEQICDWNVLKKVWLSVVFVFLLGFWKVGWMQKEVTQACHQCNSC